MDLYDDEPEYADFRVVQAMMEMFELHSPVRRMVSIGCLDDADERFWGPRQGDFPGFSGFTVNINRRLNVSPGKSSHPIYVPGAHFPPSAKEPPHFSPELKEIVEGHAETKTKKHMGKADRKRLKKRKQRERKRLEKLEKEKRNSQKKVQGKGDSKQSKAEENEGVNDKSTEKMKTSSGKHMSQSGKQDADSSGSSSSEEVSSDEESSDPESISESCEGLDLTSVFVSKAADIAKRKLEQKPKQEKKEKKINNKKEIQPAKDKPNEEQNDINKNTAAPSNPSLEDNLKISTELAELGNKYAQAGQFVTAVKHYTDAIKHNPTDYRLFGNRSYCFEKMQEYQKALTDAELSLSIFPSWVKGHYRRGRALAGLKSYDEAAEAFKNVLKLNSSCADAAQELMRVQISQLMEYGFSREQSSNALIIHGTVNKALEVLSKLNGRSATSAQVHKTLPPALSETTSRTPVASSANSKPLLPPQAQDPPKHPLMNRPLGPIQNKSNIQSEPRPLHKHLEKDAEAHQQQLELFPIWVGNLVPTVQESTVAKLFSSVGQIYSIKLLINKRCAFVNFTKKDHCDDAIRRFHGYVLMGNNIVVRYPDRIPKGMGISKLALRAEDQPNDCFKQGECVYWRSVGCYRRPGCAYRHVPEHKGIDNH
ncbi:uncharacterized protein LOC130130699 isoform X2 [Lampris incognitus]|uniref:uncharacterized protein LOC130130699 isoform X2 n=1 Tax=Lampris incognitus TaxID=2546036 RepID=UPI0024B503BF|nr:uncharacterized protein LOC130130699 isoform X2 [Lampris incognitus]